MEGGREGGSEGGSQQSSKGKRSFGECSTCGAPVSPFVSLCPYCGTDVSKRSKWVSLKLRSKARARKLRMDAGRTRRRAAGRVPKRPLRTPALDEQTPYAVGFLVLANIFGYIAFDLRGELFNDPGAFSVDAVKAGEWGRLITYQFLHTGLLELLFSAFLMVIFAIMVERRFGHLVALLTYVLAGIGGGLLALAVGSSQAVVAGSLVSTLGLMGAWLVTQLKPRYELHRYPLPAALLLIAVIFAYGALQDGLDIWALAGGLATGTIFAYLADLYQYRG